MKNLDFYTKGGRRAREAEGQGVSNKVRHFVANQAPACITECGLFWIDVGLFWRRHEAIWTRMWQREEDETGAAVQRGVSIPFHNSKSGDVSDKCCVASVRIRPAHREPLRVPTPGETCGHRIHQFAVFLGLFCNTFVPRRYTHFDNTDANYKIGEFERNALVGFSPKLLRPEAMRGKEHGAEIRRVVR